MSIKKKIFIADKFSGLEASIYGMSIIPEVLSGFNKRSTFEFPFHGLSINDANQKADEWIDGEEYAEFTRRLLQYIKKNGLSYFVNTRRQVTKEAELLLQKALVINHQMKGLSTAEFIKNYKAFMKDYAYCYGPACITFIYESILSEKLSESISRRHKNATNIISQSMNSPYRSFILESDEALAQINQTTNPSLKEKLVAEYQNRFFFMRSNYSYTPPLTKRVIIKMADQHYHHDKTKKHLTVSGPHGFRLLPEEKMIIGLFKETEIIRDQRKKINLIGGYTMFRFLDEACRRTKVDLKLGRRLFWFELPDLIKKPKATLLKIRQRREASLIFDGKRIHYLTYNALESRTTIDKSTREFRGTAASAGQVRGRVRIVSSSRDFNKFKTGEILVTEMTRPDFAPIMKKALAIVTDEGGLTSHAAIVARELKKPCIVGTKIASQILKSGDLVEVNADKGSVKKFN